MSGTVSALVPAPGGPAPRPEPTLRDAAAGFEGYLIGMMLRVSTRPLLGEAPLDGGSAGRMYREMLYEEVAKLAARRSELGIGRLLELQAGERRAGGSR